MNEYERQIEQQIPRLRRYARALTGDRDRADDLVQDSLERAWSRFSLWRRGSDLRAWLFTIMHNVFVNQLRARSQERDQVPLLEEIHDVAVAPAQDSALDMRDLAGALALLPTEQREVLLLVGLEEMTYAEAAKVLDIPIGTVMSRLARGRERLRGLLAGTAAAPTLRVVK